MTISCTPQVRGNKYTCLLAEQCRGKNFILYKPNIGKQSQLESLDNLQKRYRRVGGTCSPQCGEVGRAFIVTLSLLLVALLWMGRDGGSTGCPESQPWIFTSLHPGQWKIPNAECSAAGAARGGQGALGEQLPLLLEEL